MGFLIAIGILLLILSLRIGVSVGFGGDLSLKIRIGPLAIPILPAKEKTLKLKDYRLKVFQKNREAEAAGQAAAAEKKAAKKDEKKRRKLRSHTDEAVEKAEGTYEEPERDIPGLIKKLTRVASAFLRCFGKHLRVDVKRLVLIIATGEAASTAVLWGGVIGAVQLLLAVLGEAGTLHFSSRADIRVEADYLGEKPQAEVDIGFSFRLWHIFHMAFAALFAFLKKDPEAAPKNG